MVTPTHNIDSKKKCVLHLEITMELGLPTLFLHQLLTRRIS